VPALSPTVINVSYTASDKSFIIIIGVVDGKMYLPEVQDAGPGKLTFSGPPGTYAVMGMEDGKRIQQTIVVEGDDSPDPPPPPPPPGKRSVVVIYENELNTPAFTMAVQKLHQYADTKGHWFRVLDDDAKTPDNKPSKLVQDLLAQAANAKVKEPFLVVGDGSDGVGNVIAIVPFPDESGKAIEVLRKFGG